MKKNITKHDALVYAINKLNAFGVNNRKIAMTNLLRETTLGEIARGNIIQKQRDKFLRSFIKEIDHLYRMERKQHGDSVRAMEILQTERNIMLISVGLPTDEEFLCNA